MRRAAPGRAPRLATHRQSVAPQGVDHRCASRVVRAAGADHDGLGALPAFVDDATAHYREAIAGALVAADADDPHWRNFLLHLDNDAEAVTSLLAGMLARREQWLRLPIGMPDVLLRAELEAALRREADGALQRLVNLIPQDLAGSLREHQAYAAGNLDAEGLTPERAQILRTLSGAGGLPMHDATGLDGWRELADWLLVKDEARFRAALTKNVGFPASRRVRPNANWRRPQ